MAEKNDSSNKLPDHPTTVTTGGDLAEGKAEAVTITALPVSESL